MANQLMLQQFFTEERVRSEGNSGIKNIRNQRTGRKNYFSESHSGHSVAASHDHANNIRTVGMGEFVGVLNGVEFRTRHNDYRLYMPHRTSKDWHKIENIPFPDVPPEVKKHKHVNDQIKEMREWFKAWRDQDHSVRDYRKYFKPVLCYLEGTWTNTGSKIDEPFHSDRHFLDAKSWFDLQEKFRFTSYTGTKNRLENLAFLPTTIVGLVNGTTPVFAQWNYRILCHPLSKDVPTGKFRLVDDVANRMRYKRSHYQYLHSRAARFTLNDDGNDRPVSGKTFLDELMEEIPGKDNYAGNLTEAGYEDTDRVMELDGTTVKNVARYHRVYRVMRKDAMGLQLIRRGFSDGSCFFAMTNQHRVTGLSVTNPRKCRGWGKNRKCERITQKWSYAVPLEVIYLTPLHKWNPYNLKYKGEARSPSGREVTKDRRYGQCDSDKKRAYNGTNSVTYFRTPIEFYSGREVNGDAADTSRSVSAVCIKRKHRAREGMVI